jgi:rRNA maturation endonuclease Nob1
MSEKAGDSGESQLLRCVGCGNFFPAIEDNSDELKPVGASGNSCSSCGSDSFERVNSAELFSESS